MKSDAPARNLALLSLLALALAVPCASADGLDNLLGGPKRDDAMATLSGPEILPVDEAFLFSAEPTDDGRLVLRWDVQPGYYLYRDKIAVRPLGEPAPALQLSELPEGRIEDDPIFGKVRVFDDPVTLNVAAEGRGTTADTEVEVRYQGCAAVGVCYPPVKRRVYLPLATGSGS